MKTIKKVKSTQMSEKLVKLIKNTIIRTFLLLGFEIKTCRKPTLRIDDRFSYQSKYFNFDSVKNNSVVVDIGTGSYPFPYATIVCDRFVKTTQHRSTPLKLNGKPFIILDVEYLPFKTKAVDFLYCSHVLEHIENPEHACSEIQRVAKSGYIETPNFMKDALFCWSSGMHKWHTIYKNNTLFFIEYTEEELKGIKSTAWLYAIYSPFKNPIQDAFYENQNIFNTMFIWKDSFKVLVVTEKTSKC